MAQEPRQIDMEEACALASGHDHCMAVTPGGKLLTWGTAEGGRLGRVPEGRASKVDSGAEEEQLAPREVPDLPPVAKVSAGLFTSFAVSAGGEVFGWGGNNYGQLATREEGPFFFPQRISPLRCVALFLSGARLELTADLPSPRAAAPGRWRAGTTTLLP